MSSENPYHSSVPPRLNDSFPRGIPGNSLDQPPDAIETLIPYRNKPALIAYYSGLFSLFPVFGLPLAIIALIFGFKGLGLRKRQPNVKGTAHAWIGILSGSIGLLINLCIFTGIIVAIVTAVQQPR